MSGPYVAAFLIKGSYGELTPHPALRTQPLGGRL